MQSLARSTTTPNKRNKKRRKCRALIPQILAARPGITVLDPCPCEGCGRQISRHKQREDDTSSSSSSDEGETISGAKEHYHTLNPIQQGPPAYNVNHRADIYGYSGGPITRITFRRVVLLSSKHINDHGNFKYPKKGVDEFNRLLRKKWIIDNVRVLKSLKPDEFHSFLISSLMFPDMSLAQNY